MQPRRIKPLARSVASQIAAGEVVERPASVLKELLENAADAGATRVDVEIDGAGVGGIKVTDDGVGIHHDDLGLALTQHATSKLADAADLQCIETLGFRGEALASIASVANVSITTRTHSDSHGWSIVARGASEGEELAVAEAAPAAHAVGTTIEVRDLFFSVPARRRFLRSPRTELRHIESVLRNFALVQSQIRLQAKSGRRYLVRSRSTHDSQFEPSFEPERARRRLEELLGREFAERALLISSRSDALALGGWAMPIETFRSVADQQHVFLNARPLTDPVLRHAIRTAYEAFLQPGQQPAYVLYLTMAASAVDVNVHPTKQEVRFRDPRLVHDFVVSSLRHALVDRPTDIDGDGSETTDVSTLVVRELAEPGLPRAASGADDGGFSEAAISRLRSMEQPGGRARMLSAPRGGPIGRALHDIGQEQATWQLVGNFAVRVEDDVLHVVDCGAVAASVVSANVAQGRRTIPLLLPIPLDRSLRSSARHRLEELGFVLRHLDDAGYQVTSVPEQLRYCDHARLIEDLIGAADAKASTLTVERHLSATYAAQPGTRPSSSQLVGWLELLREVGVLPDARLVREADAQELSSWLSVGEQAQGE
jgi:DNA mismatch repair protein MutL